MSKDLLKQGDTQERMSRTPETAEELINTLNELLTREEKKTVQECKRAFPNMRWYSVDDAGNEVENAITSVEHIDPRFMAEIRARLVGTGVEVLSDGGIGPILSKLEALQRNAGANAHVPEVEALLGRWERLEGKLEEKKDGIPKAEELN